VNDKAAHSNDERQPELKVISTGRNYVRIYE
jgi:hypothetical protein